MQFALIAENLEKRIRRVNGIPSVGRALKSEWDFVFFEEVLQGNVVEKGATRGLLEVTEPVLFCLKCLVRPIFVSLIEVQLSLRHS